ncbi:MAG: hypothetical protein AB8B96_14485 [Lysobacterales bacterium]
MTNFLRIVQVAVFSAVLIAPLLTFLIMGPIDAFENRDQTLFPTIFETLAPNPEGREQLVSAVLERSAAKRFAISTRNQWLRTYLGFVDEKRVVSGASGWLFYRPAIAAWDCGKLKSNLYGLDRLVTMVELADAASAPLVFAIAPNKASVMHDKLTGRASIRARCYLDFEKTFRSRIQQVASPRIVDHYDVLKNPTELAPTYFRTDTHWTGLGGVRAIAQLGNSKLLSNGPSVTVTPPVGKVEAKTDLNTMILSDEREKATRHRVAVNGKTRKYPKLTIVHDSFYGKTKAATQVVFPEANYVHYRELESLILQPDSQVIIESVERYLLGRISSDKLLGWRSHLGHWLLEKSSQASKDCAWSSGVDLLGADARLVKTAGKFVKDEATLVTTTGNELIRISVPKEWSGGNICLQVDIRSAQGSRMQVQLPLSQTPDQSMKFSQGASVFVHYKKHQSTHSIVLPGRIAGNEIRVSPSRAPGAIVQGLRIAPIIALSNDW